MDAQEILANLQRRAQEAVDQFDLDEKIGEAKDAAANARERLETDPEARAATAGIGGLLLVGLLGTKGGRSILGSVAKTGAVAALGAIAYKAWQEQTGTKTEPAGFTSALESDPAFALAVVRAMLASAYADGVMDAKEREFLSATCEKAGIEKTEQEALLIDMPRSEAIELIAASAATPNHAAELFAAAVVAAGDVSESEKSFLDQLAKRLGISESYAATIMKAAS